MGKHSQLCGRSALSFNENKSREQNAAGQTRRMRFRRRSIIPLQIPAFTVLPPGTNYLCTTPSESEKKIINMVLMRDLWNFSFFDQGDV